MTRVFLYTFISLFIFACNSNTEKDMGEKNNNSQFEEKRFFNLDEKCFKDTAAHIIFKINEKGTDKLSLMGFDDDVILDYDETKLNIGSVHKDFGDRYFLLCYTKDSIPEIWEIEISTGNLMFVDLDTSSINNSNILIRCK